MVGSRDFLIIFETDKERVGQENISLEPPNQDQ